MATATIAEIRVVTGWAIATISNDDLTTLLGLASDYISAFSSGANSGIVKLSEIYLTAHLGELSLTGNQVSSSQGGVNASFAVPTRWYSAFKEVFEGTKTVQIKKVY